MDYYDGVDKPVTKETLKNWRAHKNNEAWGSKPVTEETIANTRKEKVAFDTAQREREEATKKKRESAEALARAIKNSKSELGGPHVLETMRGLLGEI
jgi:hypothetical protein